MIYADTRPETYDEVAGQTQTILELKDLVARYKKSKDRLPDLLLKGPPGSGKTTVGKLVAKDFLGPGWRDRYLEINASAKRGIDEVRDRIIPLTQKRGFRIIQMEEVDDFTRDGQMAMRRTMEESVGCTFIMTCNYSFKLIDAIESRCVPFYFNRLTDIDVKQALGQVIEKRGILFGSANSDVKVPFTQLKIDDQKAIGEGLDALVQEAHGDMRYCLNILEKLLNENSVITPKEVTRVRKSDSVIAAFNLAYKGDIDKARELIEDAFIISGYNRDKMITELYRAITTEIADKEIRARLHLELSRRENDIRHDNDPIVQIVGLLSYVHITPHLPKSILVKA